MEIISATPERLDSGSSTPPPFNLHVAASGIEGDPDPSHNFDLFSLTASSALNGQTFTLDAELAARFAGFMTNGIQGNLVFEMRDSAGGSAGLHSRKINFSPGSLNGIDLKGFIVDGCDLRVDSYEDLGQQPNGIFSVRSTVTFFIRGLNPTQATRAALTQIILFGVSQDACGVVIRPCPCPIPIGLWGWTSLPAADQQTLINMAERQVTRLLLGEPE